MHRKTKSAWPDEGQKRYPALSFSLDADVCVIGGGLTGLLCAYLLSKEGKKVVVLEKDRIGSGATRLTTAFLTESVDTNFFDLIRSFGLAKAKTIVSSHRSAIDMIERIIKDHSIDCDFTRCSNRIYAARSKDMRTIEIEREAASELGCKTKLVHEGLSLGFINHGYLELFNQARFNPIKFLNRLAEICEEGGVRIFEKTEAEDVDVSESGTAIVHTDRHSIHARWAVSATYSPFSQPMRLFFKKGMYVSYVLDIHTALPLPEGIYEDTHNPYHYLRIENDGAGSRVLIGGADHRENIPINEMRNYNALDEYFKGLIPGRDYEIRGRWIGPILEPVDGLAFIGPVQNGQPLLYATAFSGNGMTYSAIAAAIIADHIAGRDNPWSELYAADRMPGLSALVTKGRDFTEVLARGALKNALTQSKKPFASK